MEVVLPVGRDPLGGPRAAGGQPTSPTEGSSRACVRAADRAFGEALRVAWLQAHDAALRHAATDESRRWG